MAAQRYGDLKIDRWSHSGTATRRYGWPGALKTA